MSGKGGKGTPNPNDGQPPSKTKELLNEVEKVKGVMHNNIQSLSKNLDSVEMLETKSSQMRDSSRQFASNSRALKKQMWWKNFKLQIIIAVIVLFYCCCNYYLPSHPLQILIQSISVYNKL